MLPAVPALDRSSPAPGSSPGIEGLRADCRRVQLELRGALGVEGRASLLRGVLDRAVFVAVARAMGLLDPSAQTWAELVEVFAGLESMGGAVWTGPSASELARLRVGDATSRQLASLGEGRPLCPDTLGQLFEGGLVRRARRDAGVFFTPASLADFVVQETLGRSQRDPGSLRVLDPACGGGAFLLAAHRAVRRATGEAAVANFFGVDKNGEALAVARRALWLEHAKAQGRLEPAPAQLVTNLRQGDSVVDDPQVDPWAFDWSTGRRVGVGAGASTWPARFDLILGNPPFVRHEQLGPFKAHWRERFSTYEGGADLFVYFIERGLELLAPGGRLGFVVSNKWLRGGYAARLRERLARDCTVELLVDHGHAPVFAGADAFPCVLCVRKGPPTPTHAVQVIQGGASAERFAVPQRSLAAAPWSLEPPAVRALVAALRERAVPLADYAGIKPHYGVKTGCNAALLVDGPTRDRLCREDPRSAEILVKYLRGQDVGRWSSRWQGRWMIFTRRGVDIEAYPAIKAHLEHFRARLEPRPRGHAGPWTGRKAGGYAWYELQDAVDYHAAFEAPKIVYQVIQFHPRYALDRGGHYTNDKAFFLPSSDPWLLACLNSPAMWWHNWRSLVHMKDEALNPAGDKMIHAPIPQPTEAQRERVARAVEAVVAARRANDEANAAIVDELRCEWGVERAGKKLGQLVQLAELDGDSFVREVERRRAKGSPRLSDAARVELRAVFDAEAPKLRERRASIAGLERRIAATVHAAWALNPDELARMRATAPPRMPTNW